LGGNIPSKTARASLTQLFGKRAKRKTSRNVFWLERVQTEKVQIPRENVCLVERNPSEGLILFGAIKVRLDSAV
jgi:hypothetical protein